MRQWFFPASNLTCFDKCDEQVFELNRSDRQGKWVAIVNIKPISRAGFYPKSVKERFIQL